MAANRKQKLIDLKVKNLLSQMTLEEKIAQLGSFWIYELQSDGQLDQLKLEEKLTNGIGQITRNAGASNLEPNEAARSINRIQKFLKEKTRLGIPAINHEECCAGLMAPGATVFPQMLGLASTFQPELAERMTGAICRQMRAIGAQQGLAPVLDVARDPRWGRVEETFGEDPTLVSQFGAAYIKGLQGDDLRQGVIATGKHFVGHSFSQGGLNCGPVQIGPHDLWEVYLAPFQAAIQQAGLESVMNAYPELDGELVAGSQRILTGLLRDKLGFNGLVVSDYEAVSMIHTYHYAAEDLSTAACKALSAGIDVELPSVAGYGNNLINELEHGRISIEIIDRSVYRHLQKKFELGLFDNPFVDEGLAASLFDIPEDRNLAYEIACKSMVLLKNNGLLPLDKKISRLAVIGPNANSARNLVGDYSYAATAQLLGAMQPFGSAFGNIKGADLEEPTVKISTILDAIRDTVSSSTVVDYCPGCGILSADRTEFDSAIELAKDADVVILVLGDRSGLTLECSTGEFRDSSSLELPGVQEELARKILEVGKPVVLVLINGRPASISNLEVEINAILEAWLPGEEGGRAVAAALFGDVNPGGKLPITIPRSVGQVPTYYNHKPSGRRSNIYGDYVAEPTGPLFPFGHGLSYTRFSYEDLTISRAKPKAGEIIDISLKVTNTGSRSGDDVIQLYTRDVYASIPRPVKELRGFKRINLQPGESRSVIFHLPINQLAFYDEELQLILEGGTIQVMVGSSSDDIRLTGEFEIDVTGKYPVKTRVFECQVEVR